MSDPGAVLVIVVVVVLAVLAARQPLGPGSEGFARRQLNAPTATARQFLTLEQCEAVAANYENDLDDKPLKSRTVRVFCVVP